MTLQKSWNYAGNDIQIFWFFVYRYFFSGFLLQTLRTKKFVNWSKNQKSKKLDVAIQIVFFFGASKVRYVNLKFMSQTQFSIFLIITFLDSLENLFYTVEIFPFFCASSIKTKILKIDPKNAELRETFIAKNILR